MFSAAPSTCAAAEALRLNWLWKNAATWALVIPVRLLAPAPAPYRLGNVAASQADSAVAVEPPLKLLISAWPLRCQKLTPPVWPFWTPSPRLVTVAVPPAVAVVV